MMTAIGTKYLKVVINDWTCYYIDSMSFGSFRQPVKVGLTEIPAPVFGWVTPFSILLLVITMWCGGTATRDYVWCDQNEFKMTHVYPVTGRPWWSLSVPISLVLRLCLRLGFCCWGLLESASPASSALFSQSSQEDSLTGPWLALPLPASPKR